MKKVGKALDYIFNKMLPKKLIVYVVSTWLVQQQINIPSEYWYVVCIYLLGNAVKGFANNSYSLPELKGGKIG